AWQNPYHAQVAASLTRHPFTFASDVSRPVTGPYTGRKILRHSALQAAGSFACAEQVLRHACTASCLFTSGLTLRGGRANAVAAHAVPTAAATSNRIAFIRDLLRSMI